MNEWKTYVTHRRKNILMNIAFKDTDVFACYHSGEIKMFRLQAKRQTSEFVIPWKVKNMGV